MNPAGRLTTGTFRHSALRLAWVAACLLVAVSSRAAEYEPEEGDIVFQSMPRVPLVDAIEGVTGSPWSHCGIVLRAEAGWAVLEAVGPVKITPFASWVTQARDDRFVAYRLVERPQDRIAAFIAAARTYLGRPYDIRYEMDDAKIYCSELVQKAFKHATGRALGKPRRLGEMNWKPYEAFIRQLEGGDLPLDREIVSPQALTESPELAQVY